MSSADTTFEWTDASAEVFRGVIDRINAAAQRTVHPEGDDILTRLTPGGVRYRYTALDGIVSFMLRRAAAAVEAQPQTLGVADRPDGCGAGGCYTHPEGVPNATLACIDVLLALYREHPVCRVCLDSSDSTAEGARRAVWAALHEISNWDEGAFVHVYRGDANLGSAESRALMYRNLFGLPTKGALMMTGGAYDGFVADATSRGSVATLTPGETDLLEIAIVLGIPLLVGPGGAARHDTLGGFSGTQRRDLIGILGDVLLCNERVNEYDPNGYALVAILNLYRAHPAMIPDALKEQVDGLLVTSAILEVTGPGPNGEYSGTVSFLDGRSLVVPIPPDTPSVRGLVLPAVASVMGEDLTWLRLISENECRNKEALSAKAETWGEGSAVPESTDAYTLTWTRLGGEVASCRWARTARSDWVSRHFLDLDTYTMEPDVLREQLDGLPGRQDRNRAYLRDVARRYAGRAKDGSGGHYVVYVAGEEGGAVQRHVSEGLPRGVLRALSSISEYDTYAMEPEQLQEKLVEHLEGYRKSWYSSFWAAMPFYGRHEDTTNLYREPKVHLPALENNDM